MHSGSLECEHGCVGTAEAAAALILATRVQCSVWVEECVHGYALKVEAHGDDLASSPDVCVLVGVRFEARTL